MFAVLTMPKGGENWTVRRLLTTVALSGFIPTMTALVGFGIWLSSTMSEVVRDIGYHSREIASVKADSFTRDMAAREFRRVDDNIARIETDHGRQFSEIRKSMDERRVRSVGEVGYDTPRRAAQNLERAIRADADMASRAIRPQ